MKKRNALMGVFSLLFTGMLLMTSCGGGSGGSSSSDDGIDGSADESPDSGSGTPVDDGTPTGNPINTGVNTPISSLSFDLTGAVGLAIDNSPPPSGLGALVVDSGMSSSNLKKVNPDNSLSDAVRSGTVNVQSFMVAANNQIYLLLTSPVDSCILVRVDGATNESSCVDSNLSQIGWSNAFGDPIQFDGEGNVYYQGNSGGKTILRENSAGTTTDLINDNILLKGFLVLNDGTVFVTGTTSSTSTQWTRIITPTHSLKPLLASQPNSLTLFPDNNVYFGINSNSMNGIGRYLTATSEFDPKKWIGDPILDYSSCPADINLWRCSQAHSFLKTTNGKVFTIISNNNNERVLAQYYPTVSLPNSMITDVTVSRGILSYIFLGGVDVNAHNKLVLYDTGTDTETDLLGDEDIEVYHLNYLNSGNHQIVMFDGLRFSDNRNVLCQVDLTDNNTLTCSKTGTHELTDFQLFDNTDTIAGGDTNATKTYTIGGNITGLYGTLVLQNKADDTLALTKNGSFTFPIAIADDYDVTIQTQPQGQTCTISEGTGTVSDTHITTVSVACSTNPGVIVTVAADLSSPSNVVLDTSGNLYFSNTGNNWIRKVDASGIITTVAGNGSSGFSGDGGPATGARLNSPVGIAFDSAGNLYFADSNNHRVRKVDTNGFITTVAGNGSSGFSGDGGTATSASLYLPRGIAIDSSDNLFIVDDNNYRIRKVDTNGIITTFAGNGNSGFSGDGGAATAATMSAGYYTGIFFDGLGNLYFADSNNYRIRKIATNGIISTIAGNGSSGFSGDGGAAIGAKLSAALGVAVDSTGNLYIADAGNLRIRKVDTSGIISTVAGDGTQDFFGDGGPAVNAALDSPYGVAIDSLGNLFIADTSNNRIRMVAGE